MNHSNKVHSSTQGSVPFSWENQPGISKITYKEYPKDEEDEQHQQHGFKLPLPPCSSDSPKVIRQVVGLQIPLPPCPFQPLITRNSSSSSSRKQVLRRHSDLEDPFLAAYKECTKSTKSVHGQSNLSKKGKDDHHHESRGFGKISFMFSCKKSCGVREDNLIRSNKVSPPVLREGYYWKQENGRKEMLEGAIHNW